MQNQEITLLTDSDFPEIDSPVARVFGPRAKPREGARFKKKLAHVITQATCIHIGQDHLRRTAFEKMLKTSGIVVSKDTGGGVADPSTLEVPQCQQP